MRKDIKNRLEKALVTLQEPGGSTIQSIFRIINQDSPLLSLRKVLEALQEGINEGFLCMYNGRFKLRQHMYLERANSRFSKSGSNKVRCKKWQDSPNSNIVKDESECELDHEEEEEEEDEDEEREKNREQEDERELEEEEEEGEEEEMEDEEELENEMEEDEYAEKLRAETMTTKAQVSKTSQNHSGEIKAHARGRTPERRYSYRKKRFAAKEGQKSNESTRRQHRQAKEAEEAENPLLMSSSSTSNENQSSKQPVEKPDLKKQRGPRCTSMKKDVRMPSKVHIPFIPPSVPQKSNFNDLLRRSPESVNGPLFDKFNLEYFGTFKSY